MLKDKVLTSLTVAAGFLAICLPTFGQSSLTLDQLTQKINHEFSKQTGVFAVAFKDLTTGKELLIREYEEFHAASTMKTPVMVEVYKQAAQRNVSLTDSMLIFDKIARSQAVSPEASKAMTATLLDQKFNTIIPAKLPENVKVAHKTGSLTGVRHDSGIIFLPDGRMYVLVLLSKGIKDDVATCAAMATVSEWIYQYEMQ